MSGFVKVPIRWWIANLDFDELEHESMQDSCASELDQRTSKFEREWKNIMDDCSKTALNHLLL